MRRFINQNLSPEEEIRRSEMYNWSPSHSTEIFIVSCERHFVFKLKNNSLVCVGKRLGDRIFPLHCDEVIYVPRELIYRPL